jgi:hypothetical protein
MKHLAVFRGARLFQGRSHQPDRRDISGRTTNFQVAMPNGGSDIVYGIIISYNYNFLL